MLCHTKRPATLNGRYIENTWKFNGNPPLEEEPDANVHTNHLINGRIRLLRDYGDKVGRQFEEET